MNRFGTVRWKKRKVIKKSFVQDNIMLPIFATGLADRDDRTEPSPHHGMEKSVSSISAIRVHLYSCRNIKGTLVSSIPCSYVASGQNEVIYYLYNLLSPFTVKQDWPPVDPRQHLYKSLCYFTLILNQQMFGQEACHLHAI